MSAQSGRNSGGDLSDMAVKGTTVPEDSAVPRHIKSVPRSDQIASSNDLGSSALAGAAGEGDIPRSHKDTTSPEIVTGTGDSLPPQVDSKRLHRAGQAVQQDPFVKGDERLARRKKQDSEFDTGASDGAIPERAPGEENLPDDGAADKLERKEL